MASVFNISIVIHCFTLCFVFLFSYSRSEWYHPPWYAEIAYGGIIERIDMYLRGKRFNINGRKGKNYENVFLYAPIFMDAADGAAKMMSISSFYIIGEKFIYPIDSSPGICDDMCNLLLSDLEAT
ncbi:hypothetical protein TNCT_527661 [Trichonephila clavata]|uniref:Uncharacterized protein n=1 Tax=Trichonephila clavata TaxID=2740835 RepID=A0A8X6J4A3_TRICU|nr:hypothetical protein TNCT_527661 [Trichonephila clavata]